MNPSPAERNDLFKDFMKAFSARDIDSLYRVVSSDFLWSYHDGVQVTKSISGPEAVATHFASQQDIYSSQRFHEVAFHHLPDRTLMTFRVSETLRATGEQREQRGVEIYTFKDGRIATKDVYRKPLAG